MQRPSIEYSLQPLSRGGTSQLGQRRGFVKGSMQTLLPMRACPCLRLWKGSGAARWMWPWRTCEGGRLRVNGEQNFANQSALALYA